MLYHISYGWNCFKERKMVSICMKNFFPYVMKEKKCFDNCFLRREICVFWGAVTCHQLSWWTAAVWNSQWGWLVQKTFFSNKTSWNAIFHLAGDWQSTFLLDLNKYALYNDFLAFWCPFFLSCLAILGFVMSLTVMFGMWFRSLPFLKMTFLVNLLSKVPWLYLKSRPLNMVFNSSKMSS